MADFFDLRMVLSLGTVIFGGLSAWFAVKYGLADARKSIEGLRKYVKHELDEVKAELKAISKDNNHQWKTMSEQGSVTTRIETVFQYLERDLDRIIKKLEK